MATDVDTRPDAVVQIAWGRVAIDLASSNGQPVVAYCRDLVSWVVLGRRKPTGAPTARVRSAVCAAVNVGLKEVYGAENSPAIDSGITTRRDVL